MPDARMTGNRRISLSGVITCLTGTEIYIPADCVLSYTGINGVRDGMLPGAVVSQRCTLVLFNQNRRFTQGFSLQGARVQLVLHQGDVTLPLSVFHVDGMAQPDGSSFLTLQGTDGLDKAFESLWQDDLSYPVTIETLVNRVMEKAGYAPVDSFPGGDQLLQSRPAFGEISLRGVLSHAVQACGCFCMAAADGNICFVPAWQQEAPYEIFPENTFRYAMDTAAFGPLNAVSVTLAGARKNAEAIIVQAEGSLPDRNCCYYVSENPLFSDETTAKALARNLHTALMGMHLSRLQLRWQGDPSLRLGQRIRVWDTIGGYTDSVVTSLAVYVDEGFSMQCDCTYQPAGDTAACIFTPSGGINAARLQGEVDGALVKAESISARQLAAHAVTAEKIAAGSITSHHLAASGITADKLAAGSVTADKLAAESVSADKLASASVTAEKIAAGAIGARHIGAKTITAQQLSSGLITAESGLLANGAVGTAHIADGSITDAKIVGLTAGKITAGTLDAAQVNIVNLKADNITAGTLNGQVIPVLGSDKIADGTVSGVKLVNGAVTAEKIGENAVTAEKIVSSAVTADKLAAGSITAQKILSGAVTADKLAAHAVTAEKLAAHSVTVNHLSSHVGNSLDLTGNKSLRLMVDPLETALMEQSGQQMTISFDTGNAIEKERQTLTARVHVWKNGTDITDDIPFSAFTWTKDSGQEADAAWGTENAGKTVVTLTRVDIGKSCRISCTVDAGNSYGTFEIVNGELLFTGMDVFRLENGDLWGPDTYVLKDGTVYHKNAPGRMTVTTTAFDHSVLENSGLKITDAGVHIFTGGTFTVDSGNFSIDENGNVTVKGTVTAEDGLIGGWKIAPGSLQSGEGANHVRLSTEDATYGIWAGAEAAGSAPFRVARDGTVYLTKLYVTDENGEAQANPVNLRTSYWKMDKAYARAVQSMEVEGDTLTITLHDGTTVNFKKAAVSTINLVQTWNGGRLVISTNTEGITLSGQLTASVNSSPANLEWSGKVATFDVTSDRGTIVSGMQVDASDVYEEGYAAGYAAAKAAVTVDGWINTITNTAANYFFAQGQAVAYVDGEQVAADTFSKGQQISVGQ